MIVVISVAIGVSVVSVLSGVIVVGLVVVVSVVIASLFIHQNFRHSLRVEDQLHCSLYLSFLCIKTRGSEDSSYFLPRLLPLDLVVDIALELRNLGTSPTEQFLSISVKQ